MEIRSYREFVGALAWVALGTRPDIAFAASSLVSLDTISFAFIGMRPNDPYTTSRGPRNGVPGRKASPWRSPHSRTPIGEPVQPPTIDRNVWGQDQRWGCHPSLSYRRRRFAKRQKSRYGSLNSYIVSVFRCEDQSSSTLTTKVEFPFPKVQSFMTVPGIVTSSITPFERCWC